MKMESLFIAGRKPVIFDGAMGTYLQSLGSYTEAPITYNLSNPEVISKIHCDYIDAGAEVITANTFGAYEFKYTNYSEIIESAMRNAKNAVGASSRQGIYIALDIGPTGKLTPPLGNASFNELYNIFKETAILGEKYGADFALIETMQDIGELRAAILAVKENTELPVFCTVSFEKNGRTLSGADPLAIISIIEGLGADALGFNCGAGMELSDKLAGEFIKFSSIPILIQPNAGLPETQNGIPVYKLGADSFAEHMRGYAEKGASFLGGCCGTTPKHIKAVADCISSILTPAQEDKGYTAACSYGKGLILSGEPVTVGCVTKGELVEDAGESAIDEMSDGAEIISIFIGENGQNSNKDDIENYGTGLISAVSEVCSTPLILCVDSQETGGGLEPLLRAYNGTAVVTGLSVKDRIEIGIYLDSVMSAAKKYGAVLVFDCEGASPEMVENIYLCADRHGVLRRNILLNFGESGYGGYTGIREAVFEDGGLKVITV